MKYWNAVNTNMTCRETGRQTLYGYDEFGEDLLGNQGEVQPFGYTGYQRDPVAGTYFAQAREYLPEAGRFMGKDLIKGMADVPFTLNEYGYCWNNPLIQVDKNGRSPVPGPADAQRMMWEYCVDQYHNALNTIKREWDEKVDSVVEWGKEHEDEIKMGMTDAAIVGSALLAGTGIGIPAGIAVMAIGSTGALMGEQYYEENGMNGADMVLCGAV